MATGRRPFTLPPRQRPGGRTIEIAVLVSGSGTNLQALLDIPSIRPHIVLVASDRDDALALRRAADAGVPTGVVRWQDHSDRESFSAAFADLVQGAGAKGVVLAGFMRVLHPCFVERFRDRILNVHPSLLPAFPGARAVEAALQHAVRLTGITVHLVDEKVDHGPILTQAPVEVRPHDTVESLHRRLKDVEHRIYPQAVTALIEDRIVVEGRRAVLR